MPPAQSSSSPSPALAASPRTQLLSQDPSGRAQTGCLHSSNSCIARERQQLLCMTKCTCPAKRICPVFMANTTVCSLHSCWKQEQTSVFLLSLYLSTAICRQSANLRFAKQRIFTEGSEPAAKERHLPALSHPLLGSQWCVLCPSDQLWSCCRVAGHLSHPLLESCSHVIADRLDPLPFLQQEHLSHHSLTCCSRTELWPIHSYLPFWGTEGFFKVPFGTSFLKHSIQEQSLYSLCWLITGQSKTHFSQPWVHRTYIFLDYHLLQMSLRNLNHLHDISLLFLRGAGVLTCSETLTGADSFRESTDGVQGWLVAVTEADWWDQQELD